MPSQIRFKEIKVKMKLSFLLAALMFTAAFAQRAFADTYDITLLAGTSTAVYGYGSFTYNPAATTDPFSNFTVTWDSIVFNLTSGANSTPDQMYGCDYGVSISVFTFLTNAGCQENQGEAWGAGVGSDEATFYFDENGIPLLYTNSTGPGLLGEDGEFTVTDITPPEPRHLNPPPSCCLAQDFSG